MMGSQHHPKGRGGRHLMLVNPTQPPAVGTWVAIQTCPTYYLLLLLLLNTRSVHNKATLIHDLTMDEVANLVCITEKWAGEQGWEHR